MSARITGSYVYTPEARASRRLGLFLLIMLGVLLTVGLFYVKTRAQEARADVRRLERSIAAQQAAIDVLQAERAVLSAPDRLRALSSDQLGLEPIRVADTRATVEDAAP